MRYISIPMDHLMKGEVRRGRWEGGRGGPYDIFLTQRNAVLTGWVFPVAFSRGKCKALSIVHIKIDFFFSVTDTSSGLSCSPSPAFSCIIA